MDNKDTTALAQQRQICVVAQETEINEMLGKMIQSYEFKINKVQMKIDKVQMKIEKIKLKLDTIVNKINNLRIIDMDMSTSTTTKDKKVFAMRMHHLEDNKSQLNLQMDHLVDHKKELHIQMERLYTKKQVLLRNMNGPKQSEEVDVNCKNPYY